MKSQHPTGLPISSQSVKRGAHGAYPHRDTRCTPCNIGPDLRGSWRSTPVNPPRLTTQSTTNREEKPGQHATVRCRHPNGFVWIACVERDNPPDTSSHTMCMSLVALQHAPVLSPKADSKLRCLGNPRGPYQPLARGTTARARSEAGAKIQNSGTPRRAISVACRLRGLAHVPREEHPLSRSGARYWEGRANRRAGC